MYLVIIPLHLTSPIDYRIIDLVSNYSGIFSFIYIAILLLPIIFMLADRALTTVENAWLTQGSGNREKMDIRFIYLPYVIGRKRIFFYDHESHTGAKLAYLTQGRAMQSHIVDGYHGYLVAGGVIRVMPNGEPVARLKCLSTQVFATANTTDVLSKNAIAAKSFHQGTCTFYIKKDF